MTGDWMLFPPWTNEQGPTNISPGSLIKGDFRVVNHTFDADIQTSFCWSGLSRQEVANLRNLASSDKLKELLLSHDYGISTGMSIDMLSDEDPNDAEFDLAIYSKQDIPQSSMRKIVDFIRHYTVP